MDNPSPQDGKGNTMNLFNCRAETSSCARVLMGMLFFCLGCLSARADWDSLTSKDLMKRSKFIGVGELSHFGNNPDDTINGKIKFRRTIYSGIGEVKTLEVPVAKVTVPGKSQTWKTHSRGVWFILKSGDAYAAVNHPGCRLDQQHAKSVADDVYAWQNAEYEDAEEEASEEDGSESGSSSDSDSSVSAYESMVSASEAAMQVPFQDVATQQANYYKQAMSMLEAAGIDSPFPADLTSGAGQQQLLSQLTHSLGPAGRQLSSALSGQLGAKELGGLQQMAGQMISQLVGNTMGSQDPFKALSQMKPIEFPLGDLLQSSGRGPGPMGGKTPSLELPMQSFSKGLSGGSRQDMLGSAMKQIGGGSRGGMPKMPSGGRGPGGPPGGGRPGPR